MKKITLFLALTVIAGSAFVSYWAYQRYFKKPELKPLTYRVERGDIVETLRVRGEVAAEREYDLAFSSYGTIEAVPVKEGQVVQTGELLMRLDTTELSLELDRSFAERAQALASLEGSKAALAQALAARDAASAKLDELQSGVRPETLQVQQAKIEGARAAHVSAEASLMEALQNAYTAADDAVHNSADQALINPRSDAPRPRFAMSDEGLKTTLSLQRQQVEELLGIWKKSLTSLTPEKAPALAAHAQADVATIKQFLDGLALALNGAIPSGDTTASAITTWQSGVSTARAKIDTASVSLNAAEASHESATSALTIAENELAVLKAGNSTQQIAAQAALLRQTEASVAAAQADINRARATVAVTEASSALLREKIRKASLVAPAAAKVTKIWLKQNEQYQQSLQGMPAISLATIGIKVQSDVSELDIPKLREMDGNEITAVFDAFPERDYTGTIVSIEPKEIKKDVDTYYRVNMSLSQPSEDLRRGMSADITVRLDEKKNVLRIPIFIVRDTAGKKFVSVVDGETSREAEITTGASDGDFVEVTSGLTEGQTITTLAE